MSFITFNYDIFFFTMLKLNDKHPEYVFILAETNIFIIFHHRTLQTKEFTRDTPPEPSSHMVFTLTSAISSPVTTCMVQFCNWLAIGKKWTKGANLLQIDENTSNHWTTTNHENLMFMLGCFPIWVSIFFRNASNTKKNTC